MTPTIFRNEINFLDTENYEVSVWADSKGTDIILTIKPKGSTAGEGLEERFNVVGNTLGRKPIEWLCEVLHERNFEEAENAICDKLEKFIDNENNWLI